MMGQSKLEKVQEKHRDIFQQKQDTIEKKVMTKYQSSRSQSVLMNTKEGFSKTLPLDENDIIKKEFKNIKNNNFTENHQREMKKMEYRKLSVLEKEQIYTYKIEQQKLERAMIEKCKVEVSAQQLKNKELKMKAILKLKDLSIMNRSERLKNLKLAKQLAGDVDLEEVFKLPEKKKADDDMD